MNRYFVSGLRLSLLAALAWTPSESASAETSEVLASYRATVTADELESWLKFSPEREPTHQKFALRDLILARSLALEAERLGLERRPDVQLEIERKQAGFATAALRRHVDESIQITDEEAEAKYQEIKDTYTHPRRVRLRNLFKRYPLDATDVDKAATLTKMRQLRQRAVNGEDFGKLAAQESNSQTRFQEGMLGNVPAGTFPPEIDKVAMAMQPGEVSEILYGTDGLTLLYCEKILDKVYRTPENLRQIARNLLKKAAFKRAWNDTRETLLADATPHYHWQVLDAETPDPNAILVEITGDQWTVAEVELILRKRRTAPKPSELSREKLQKRVEKYLLERMSLREVDRLGLPQKDDDLGAQLLWARRQILASQARIHWIEKQHTAPAEEDVRQYFESHREDFVRPAFYDLSAIQLTMASDGDRATYQQAERIVHGIRSGEISFEDAARQHSQAPSAQDGGKLGPVNRWLLPHAFGFNVVKAVLAMKPGDVSDLVAEDRSLWILRLEGVEASRPMTWEEARSNAEDKLGTEQAREIEAEILSEWMEQLDISEGPAEAGQEPEEG